MSVIALVLLSTCMLQDPAPGAPPPPRLPAAAPIPPALQRAIDGAQAAGRNLLATDHAFTGAAGLQVEAAVGEMEVEPAAYHGAANSTVHLFQIGKHTILTSGTRRLERVGDGAWTLPQGDAPDCPLSPTVLAAHLPSAAIDGWQPDAHGDRPALRIHAIWKDKAAAALLDELAMPDAKADRMLESVATMVQKRGADVITVDASVFFDPATKSLYGATLRIAALQPDEPRETDPPVPCPAGLPPLGKALWFQFVFVVTVLPAGKYPVPTLDAAMRERLGLPPSPRPK